MPDEVENDLPQTIDLSVLSEAQLRGRHAELSARHAELLAVQSDTPESFTLAQARELASIVTEAAEISGLVAEFSASTEDLALLPEVEVPAAQQTVEGSTADDADAAAVALAASIAAENVFGNTTAPAVVVGEERTAPADTQTEDRPQRRYSAAGSQGAVGVGQELSFSEIGQVFESLRGDSGRTGGKVGAIRFASGLEPVITQNGGAVANTAVLMSTVGDTDNARTAAASCSPAEVIRSVESCVRRGTPVSDGFRKLRAERGSVKFLAPPGLGDLPAGSPEFWTDTEQDAVDPDDSATWKACPESDCPPEIECSIDAIPVCQTFKTFNTMTSPEWVASVLDTLGAAHDRAKEADILARLDALSSAYTASATEYGILDPLGATVNVYDVMQRLLSAASIGTRGIPEQERNWTLIVEGGFIGTLGLDALAACDAEHANVMAQSLFGDLGVDNIIVTPDWAIADGGAPYSPFTPLRTPGLAAVAVPDRPTDFKVRLFDSSSFALLEHDDEDISVIPDLAMKRQNKVTLFGERWQGLCKVGQCVPSFTIALTDVYATGARSACATVTVA